MSYDACRHSGNSHTGPVKLVPCATRSSSLSRWRCRSIPLHKTVVDLAAFTRKVVYGNTMIGEIRQRGGDTLDDRTCGISREFSGARAEVHRNCNPF